MYTAERQEGQRVHLLVEPIEFGGDLKPFDFDEVLRELSRCPTPGRQ